MKSITRQVVLLAAILFQLSFLSYGGGLVEAISRAKISAEYAAQQAKITPRHPSLVPRAIIDTERAKTLTLKAYSQVHAYAVKAELDELNRSLGELLVTLRTNPFNGAPSGGAKFEEIKEAIHVHPTLGEEYRRWLWETAFSAANVVEADAKGLRVPDFEELHVSKPSFRVLHSDFGDDRRDKQDAKDQTNRDQQKEQGAEDDD